MKKRQKKSTPQASSRIASSGASGCHMARSIFKSCHSKPKTVVNSASPVMTPAAIKRRARKKGQKAAQVQRWATSWR